MRELYGGERVAGQIQGDLQNWKQGVRGKIQSRASPEPASDTSVGVNDDQAHRGNGAVGVQQMKHERTGEMNGDDWRLRPTPPERSRQQETG